MKFLKRLTLLFTFLILLASCGYSPLYKNFDNVNFSINIIDTIGERSINNLVKSKLNTYNESNKIKNYDVKINSQYSKIIVAKDTTGAATEYKILITISFLLNNNEFNKEFIYTESFNMKSMSDRLQQQDYEKNIQNSLVSLIVRKLIMQISQIR